MKCYLNSHLLQQANAAMFVFTHDCVMPGYLSRLLSLTQTMCQYGDVVIEICQAYINTGMDDCFLFVCYSLHRIQSYNHDKYRSYLLSPTSHVVGLHACMFCHTYVMQWLNVRLTH